MAISMTAETQLVIPDPIKRKDDFTFTSSSQIHDNYEFKNHLLKNRFASFYKISLSDTELGAAYPDVEGPGQISPATSRPSSSGAVTRPPIPDELLDKVLDALKNLKDNIDKDRQETSEMKSVHIVEITDTIQAAKLIFAHGRFPFKVFSPKLLSYIAKPGSSDDTRILFEGSRTKPETSSIIVKYPVLSLALREDEQGFSNYFESKQLYGVEVPKSKLFVDWGLSLVINEDIIFVVRPRQKGTQSRLISPGQLRTGAFHLFIHSITDDIRENDRKILGIIQTMVNRYEFNIARETPASGVCLLKAINLVLDDQITTLKELQNVFSRTKTRADYTPLRKYTEDMINIPVISGDIENTNEQLQYVLASLEKVIKDREEIARKVIKFMEKIDKKIDVKSSEELQSTMKEQLDAQKVQGQALQEEITFQAKAISLFTVLNAIFLPLGFFSQYFIGSDQRNGAIHKDSLGQFWAVTGSITGLIALSTLFWLFSNYQPRQIARCVCDLFSFTSKRRRRHHILPASMVLEQEYYRRKLPRYVIKAQRIDFDGNLVEGPSTSKYLTCKKDPIDDFEHPLKFEELKDRNDIFLFDKNNGWLFHPEVDRYKYMYHPQVNCVFPHNKKEMPVEWGRSSKLLEREPYRFIGRFKVHYSTQMSLQWEFSEDKEKKGAGKRRWDTPSVKSANVFRIDSSGKLFVRNPWNDPEAQELEYYRLDLVADFTQS